MKRFGHSVRCTLIGFAALMISSACSHEPDTARVSGDVQVRIPFMNEGGGYSLQVIGLSGLTSLYEFAGKYANFYLAPSADGQRLRGTRPRAHFVKIGDVYVPQDTEVSQQMAVIYAHLQRLSGLDQELGVGDLQKGPRDVGIMTRRVKPGESKQDVNNAYYHPETDSILIVPFTSNELPISVNGGVLAHEHFHSLFYKLVGRKLAESPEAHGQELRSQVKGLKGKALGPNVIEDTSFTLAERTNWFIYMGMNEGLADFWGWVYTGDPDFLKPSVPDLVESRSLKVSEAEAKKPFTRVHVWRDTVQQGSKSAGCDFYCLGTEYSRSLKGFAGVVEKSRGVSSLQARKIVARAVLDALPPLALNLQALKEDEMFEPVNFLKFVEAALKDAKAEEVQYLKGIVNGTVGAQP